MERSFEGADWDRYAQWYDSLNELRPYERMLEDILHSLQSVSGRILDAGCGTGNLANKLLQHGAMNIVGIDMSIAMLARAKAKCRDASFSQADLGGPLPFRDRTFKTVVCVNALYALTNPADTLREFFRILRPRGALIIVTPKFGYESGLILKAHSRSRKLDPYWSNIHRSEQREEILVRESVDNEELAERLLHIARFNRTIACETSFHFFGRTELRRLIHDRGFSHVRIRTTYADQNLLLVARRR